MRVPTLVLGGLVPSAIATNLWVSSYAGNITSLHLSALAKGGYALAATSVINAPLTDKPSWLTKDDEKNVVYGVDEAWNIPKGIVASFSSSPSGKLTVIDSQTTVGGAVSAVTYNGGKALVVAHYGGSSVTTWSISAGSKLANLQTFTYKLSAPGANPERQEAPHPHEVILDPSGTFIVAPDLGADLLRVYSIDPATSLIKESTNFATPAGSGPRHGKFLKVTCGDTYFYLISELSNTIASYKVTYNANNTLSFTQVFSSGTYGNQAVPAGAAAAEAILSPDRKFLLTTSRKAPFFQIANFDPKNSTKIPSDVIGSWAIDDATGKLNFKQLVPSGGMVPRQLSTNANGTLVAVPLQADARVVILKRDAESGKIGDIVASIGVAGEVNCVIWDE